MKRHGEGKTMITFEEWWAYEGKRRRERPYSPETSRRVEQWCTEHKGDYCNCHCEAIFDKVIITRTPYA